ncbi:MAG TPA: hypothetical protein PK760_09320 [Flavobacteriales bacterium]|nr:hypothetical protein [Flavobacteriales bacterium]
MHTAGLPALLLASFMLVRCTPSEQAENTKDKVDEGIAQLNEDLRADLDKSKLELTENLRELKMRTENKIANYDDQLRSDKLTKADRKELEEARAEMGLQVNRIDAAISDVGLATRDTWLEVKDATKKLTADIEDWFRKQEEKVDKKTDADHDGDGH